MFLLYRLGSGEKRTFPLPELVPPGLALSPDGRALGLLGGEAEGDGGITVDLIDVEQQTDRRLFATEGVLYDGALSWSPDGRLLSVTYEVDDSNMFTTVVLDTSDGTVVARYSDMRILRNTNGAWLGPRHLALLTEEADGLTGPLVVVDVLSGDMRRHDKLPPEWTGGGLTVIAGRLVQTFHGMGIYASGFDGSDPRRLITTGEDVGVNLVDVAPLVSAAWSDLGPFAGG